MLLPDFDGSVEFSMICEIKCTCLLLSVLFVVCQISSPFLNTLIIISAINRLREVMKVHIHNGQRLVFM